MGRPDRAIIDSLMEIKVRLQALAATSEARRALEQLDQREATGQPLEAIEGWRLRQLLEAEVARSPVNVALRRIEEAIGLIDGTVTPELLLALSPALPPALDDCQSPVPLTPPICETPLAAGPAPAAEPIAPPADELAAIRGIDAETAELLHRLGVRRFAEIAEWRAEDVERIGRTLGDRHRIAAGNWIEQAAMLARGTRTRFADSPRPRLAASPPPSRRPVPRPELVPPVDIGGPTGPAPRPSIPTAAERAAALAATRPEVWVPPAATAAPPPDDLTRIVHVDAVLADRLQKAGVHTFADIAAWSAADVARLSMTLGLENRISRENWIEQAALLSAGRSSFRIDRVGLRLRPAPAPRIERPRRLPTPPASLAPTPSAIPVQAPPAPPTPPAIVAPLVAGTHVPTLALAGTARTGDRDQAFDDVAAAVAAVVATAEQVRSTNALRPRTMPTPVEPTAAVPTVEPPPVVPVSVATAAAAAERPVAMPARNDSRISVLRRPPAAPDPLPAASPTPAERRRADSADLADPRSILQRVEAVEAASVSIGRSESEPVTIRPVATAPAADPLARLGRTLRQIEQGLPERPAPAEAVKGDPTRRTKGYPGNLDEAVVVIRRGESEPAGGLATTGPNGRSGPRESAPLAGGRDSLITRVLKALKGD